MTLSIEQQARLTQHLEQQDALATTIDRTFEKMEQTYKAGQFEDLKNKLKAELLSQLKSLSGDDRMAITLVDIQNDFTMTNFSLYASGGENTILSNMALLDAIIELSEDRNVCKKLELITSQDAHRFGRTMDNREAISLGEAYTREQAENAVKTEQKELEPLNPSEQSYGLHCLTGTVGAAIAKPIADRLSTLESRSFIITRFGKINFSGPAAGMKLSDNIDISHKIYRDASQAIYHHSNQSYIQFFNAKQYKAVSITGICGDVCVQQAAEGLKAELENTKITVIDACTHYLVIPGVKSYDETRGAVMQSYHSKGISVLPLPYWRSNPHCESQLYPIEQTNRLLAFYLRYPNACNAILASLALTAVVIATGLTLGTGSAVVATGLGLTAFGVTFFARSISGKMQQEGVFDQQPMMVSY